MASNLNNNNLFSNPSFKNELADAAKDKMSTAEYAQDLHKEVAHDAAIMAASKAGDFAKAAESGSSEPSGEGFIAVAMETISGAIESAKEFVQDTMQHLTEGAQEERTLPCPDNSGKPFAQCAFKDELKDKVDEKSISENYQWQAHKAAANDAAVMAASKASDFAKAAEKVDAPAEPTLMDMAVDAIQSTREAVAGTWEQGKEQTAMAYKASMNKVEGAMGAVKEKAGEAMETVAEKMQQMSDTMADKASETKETAQHMQAEAQLSQQRANLNPVART